MSHHISQGERRLWRMFTLVTVAILAVPYTVIGAGPTLNTRTLGVSSSRYEQTYAQRFDRPRFFGDTRSPKQKLPSNSPSLHRSWKRRSLTKNAPTFSPAGCTGDMGWRS